MSAYYKIGDFAKEIGVSIQTLRNWDKAGQLKPAKVTNGGTRYYSDYQLQRYKGNHTSSPKYITYGYARVSSSKQKDDLERQVENLKSYMCAKGYQFEIITDIGSGINYKKKGLISLLDEVMTGRVDRIVILYKDRLIRVGFELIEHICEMNGTKIEIIDSTEKTEQE